MPSSVSGFCYDFQDFAEDFAARSRLVMNHLNSVKVNFVQNQVSLLIRFLAILNPFVSNFLKLLFFLDHIWHYDILECEHSLLSSSSLFRFPPTKNKGSLAIITIPNNIRYPQKDTWSVEFSVHHLSASSLYRRS